MNVFIALCQNSRLASKPPTECRPQANAVIERIYLTLENMLRSFELEKKELIQENPFDEFLYAMAWALKSTQHVVQKANWKAIALRRNEQIQKDNYVRENKQDYLISTRKETE